MTSNEISLDELQADAQASQPRLVSLNDVRALAEKQKVLEEELAAMEAQLTAKKNELRQVAEKELPDMLALVGLSSVTLADGSVVEIADKVSASITDENREAAHAFVREVGAADLIKNVVSVTFGKGEDEYAQLLIHNIQVMADQNSIRFGALDQKEAIHPSTLKAFVNERLKAGEPLPAETFKLYVGQIARIKKPKMR